MYTYICTYMSMYIYKFGSQILRQNVTFLQKTKNEKMTVLTFTSKKSVRLVWARHSGPDQSHGCVIMFQSISEEFPLKGRCGIGFDLSTSRLQRSCPVKASSGVTLMTSPRGCHESVCSWPALPRSVCVKLLAVCLHAPAVFCFPKRPSVGLRARPRARNDNHSTPSYLLTLNVVKWQIVRIGHRAVDACRW